MNICIISGSFPPEVGGVSTHLYNLAGYFSKLGHKVLILCPDFSIVKDFYPDYMKYRGEIFENVTVKPVPTKNNILKRESIDFQDKALWNLDEYIGDFAPEIIHVEDPPRIYGLSLFGLGVTPAYNGVIGLAYARAKNIPLIGFYQTNYGAFADSFIPKEAPTPYRTDPAGVYEMVYGSFDEVLCSCEDACRHLTAHGVKRVRQGVYMGINESVFGTGAKSTLIPQSNKVKLLYCGRFDSGKDVKTVIALFKKAYAKNSHIQLYLAGTGLFKETMEYVEKECSENSDIVYVGSLGADELVKVYNSVDIYFSPHRSDTFGLSIIEAMARALPVIAANQGGPASLVDNGVNGILCAEDDDFVHQITVLAGNGALRADLGKNGAKTAQKYYGKNCAANFINTYGELIGMKKRDVR